MQDHLEKLKIPALETAITVARSNTEKRIYIKCNRRVGGGCGSKAISERREVASTASWKERRQTQTDRCRGRTDPEGTSRPCHLLGEP